MKIRQKLMALLTVTFILSGSFTVESVEAGQIPEETTAELEFADVHSEEITDDILLSEMTAISGNDTDFPVPDEPSAFHAHIEYRQGYTVIGTFTDFTPDINLVQTLYSLDKESWQIGEVEWNLFNLCTDDEDKLYGLQNQPCVFDRYEPMKSYIAGKIDRFYLKLRITKNNGLSYETQSAVIERGGLEPIPEGTERYAFFSSAIAVSEPDPASPYRYRKYGRYQLTISADATTEEVAALLPDTLPVEVQLYHNPNFVAKSVVDCPVTWKPLSLPSLSPGEIITISDAAEAILVPNGTFISTPIGTFQLDEPLSLNNPPYTDEVKLVLNVSSEDRNPTGVLRAGKDGLEMSFHNKPTGAVSIQAYVLTEGESKWTELSDLSLQEELNQPSTANSGYALVLRNDQNPYRSYLAATEAGEAPTPFFVGLKIKGGVYDGKQLILAWPDIYEQLPELPELGGAGGNESNAGADNKDDSTESGQRPNLPQTPDDGKEEQQTNPPQTPETPSAIPESESISSTEEFVSDHLSDNDIPGQPEPIYQNIEASESGQRPNLPEATQDASDISSAQKVSRPVSQEERLKLAALAVQTAAEIKNREPAMVLSTVETTLEQNTKGSSHFPLLPIATSAIAVICGIAAVCKAAGYSLFHRIAGKIRNVLHK